MAVVNTLKALVPIGLLLFIYLLLRSDALTGPLSKIPGPAISRWTNWVLKLHVLKGDRVHYVHGLHAIYGPVVRISPSEISIADLEATKAIHKIGGGFLKSPWYMSFNSSAYPGIFSLIDPRAHATRRRLLAQSFSKSNLLKWEARVLEKAELAVSRIKEEARKQGKADILKWWTFMATDLIGELSFGDSFRMLERGEKNDYIKDLETVMMFSGIRSELPGPVSLLSILPIPAIRKINTLPERVAVYGVEAVNRHKTMALEGQLGDNPTFFSKIFAAGKSQELSDPEIEQEASNLIVAGSDTTAVTLTYLVWAILSNPAIHDRLHHELRDVPSPLRNADLEKLPFLNAVIEETLRLYGAAPGGLPRTVPAGGRTLAGYFIPESTTVSTQAFTLHRNPAIFPDPEKFQPERWLAPTPQMQEAFMPFGVGSRRTVCIGLHLARLELSLAVALFLRECGPSVRVSAETRREDMEMENYFLIAPRAHACFVTLE